MADGTAADVAWAAGIFEGEGCLTKRGRTSGEAQVGMTDKDIVERFGAIIGVGRLHVERRNNPRHSTVYRWTLTNQADVAKLICLFWPWMGERRRAAAMEMLERFSKSPGRHRDGRRLRAA